jgi:uncharacterized protein (TIGR02246 family)
MKTILQCALLSGFLIALCSPAPAQSEEKEILAPILKSADDWNRGDIKAFMESYEHSPDTTFVGSSVAKGTDAVIARYRRDYPDQDRMGKTSFSELAARPLTPGLAIVTGRYNLERKPEFGGNAHGIFSLVMRKGAGGWRIIHDHTTTLP